ncbi:MAG TPA: TonB-dependent receptor [Flavisolibacter sp.]|nr:TonB-dependent receptor [Flavisolibacter sp.]
MKEKSLLAQFCKKHIPLLIFLLISSLAFAQQVRVNGTIVSSVDGTPLSGTTVTVKGSSQSVRTDENGRFALDANRGAVLVISFVGYTSQEITVRDNGAITVQLAPASNSLNEVIVTGFTAQKRSELTAAVSTISGEEILKAPVSNITNALMGRVSGVIAQQSSGRPGMNQADLYIRGQVSSDAKALIVVDGVERETFGDIDPNEIESITVLKDAASTALYGIKGANGVFVVTTKLGRSNQTRVSFTSNVGVLGYVALPGILPAYESALLHTEGQINVGQGANRLFTNEELEFFKNGTGDPLLYPNVNWYKALTRPNWLQTQNNINISGGSKNTRYFTSFGHLFEDGMFKDFPTKSGVRTTPSYTRYNFRANVDFNPTTSTTISVRLAGRLEKRYSTQSIGSAADWRRQYEHTHEAFVNRILFIPSWGLPFFPEYTNDPFDVRNVYNKIVDYQRLGTNTFNPYAVLTGSGYWNYDNNISENIVSLTQKLDKVTRGLSFRGLVGYTASMQSVRLQTATYALYNLDRTTKAVTVLPNMSDQPLMAIRNQMYGDIKTTIQLFLNYGRSFGPHSVAANLIGTRDLRELEGANAPFANQGLVFNTSYNYRNKYFAQVNGAYNGSENYPKDIRYGLFPALSLGYAISNEDFMRDIKWLSNLKIRGSIGLVGRESFGGRRFLYLDEYRIGSPVFFGSPNNPTPYNTYNHARIGNQFITWEKSLKRNIGLDASFLKNKFSVTFDVFDDRRFDILLPRNNTGFATYGESLPDVNYGENYNRGYEIEVTHQNRMGHFNYAVNAQLSFARNRVVNADEPAGLETWRKIEGQRINQIRGYKVLGFYSDTADIRKSPTNRLTPNASIPGDFKYQDVNGDGIISELDQMPIGFSNIPEYIGGLNVSLGWKGLSATVLFQGVTNVSSDLIFYSNGLGSNTFSNQYYEPMLGRWTPNNPNPTWPAMRPGNQVGGNPNETNNDFLLQDASYLKLRNVELRYSFPQVITRRLKVQGLAVYVNGQNLKTWTNFYGLDPENYTNPANVLYNKRTTYPSNRVVNFGLNVQF